MDRWTKKGQAALSIATPLLEITESQSRSPPRNPRMAQNRPAKNRLSSLIPKSPRERLKCPRATAGPPSSAKPRKRAKWAKSGAALRPCPNGGPQEIELAKTGDGAVSAANGVLEEAFITGGSEDRTRPNGARAAFSLGAPCLRNAQYRTAKPREKKRRNELKGRNWKWAKPLALAPKWRRSSCRVAGRDRKPPQRVVCRYRSPSRKFEVQVKRADRTFDPTSVQELIRTVISEAGITTRHCERDHRKSWKNTTTGREKANRPESATPIARP